MSSKKGCFFWKIAFATPITMRFISMQKPDSRCETEAHLAQCAVQLRICAFEDDERNANCTLVQTF